MSSAHAKTLKELLAATHPKITSFKVTISEYCGADHPPSHCEWSYTELNSAEPGIFTQLKHDKTTMLSGWFSLLKPIYSAARDPSGKSKGKLGSYHTDKGQIVSRSYVCEVILKDTTDENSA